MSRKHFTLTSRSHTQVLASSEAPRDIPVLQNQPYNKVVAVAKRVNDPQVWKFFRLSMRKELISWEWLVALIIAFGEPWWAWPSIYFFLWSYRSTPSGLIVWLTIFTLSAWLTASIGALIVRMARHKKLMKAAFVRVREGLPNAEEELNAIRHHGLLNLKTRNVMVPYALAHFIIPAYVVTTLWNDIKQPPITSFKHPKITTPRQRLDATLAQWRKRGIYIKFEHED